jgi:hypothetical protein
MQSPAQVRAFETSTVVAPLRRLWIGRIMAGLITVFLLFEASMKFVKLSVPLGALS